jgi:hypothetical protein
MRITIPALILIVFAAILAMTMQSGCESGGGSSSTGTLIADFYIQGQEYLAKSQTPVEKLCSLFTPRAAYALADLGFDSNCFPLNQFTSDVTVQGDLEVLVVSPSQTFVSHGFTNTAGRVSFSDLEAGYLTLVVTGRDGHSYDIPVHVTANSTSRTKALIYRYPATGNIVFTAKTINDSDGDGINDDSFSYEIFNRPRDVLSGGVVHLHDGNETHIDANGDGDFIDTEDSAVVEPDDDGVKSDAGDGDEDNDGITDDIDGDIDGDGIPNETDPDIDSDGLLNASDPYPAGVTPLDDFAAPGLFTGLIYTGIEDVDQIAAGQVSVFFPAATDDKHNPVTYLIYYSSTSPISFTSANRKLFRPVGGGSPDQLLSMNITGLLTGQTYTFAVRVMDSAQPPNIDKNVRIKELTVE